MLYDPKRWDKSTDVTDVFSLESLIAWLEKQPAYKTYPFSNPHKCMICQYLDHVGVEYVAAGSSSYHPNSRNYQWKQLPWGNVAYDEPHTFGAALDRARELQAQA